ASPHHLSERGDVGPDAVKLLGAARRQSKPRDDLVQDQEGTVAVTEASKPLEEARPGRDGAHVSHHRLGDGRGNFSWMLREYRLDRAQVVEPRVVGQAGQSGWN